MKIRLCYRIAKEAGYGEDENGNPAEVYSCVKLNCKSYEKPKEKYDDLVELGKQLVSGQFNISLDLVTPITINEYLDMTETEI